MPTRNCHLGIYRASQNHHVRSQAPNLLNPLHYRVPSQPVTMPSSSCLGHTPGIFSASSPLRLLPLIYPADSVDSTFPNSGIGACLTSYMTTIWPDPRHPFRDLSHSPHWSPGCALATCSLFLTSTAQSLSPLGGSFTRQGSRSLY